jgi:methylmalonyl-CoA epimerase
MKMYEIAHIGIAVNDLEKSVKTFRDILGCESPKIIDALEHKIKVAMFEAGNGRTCIELLTPTEEQSSIKKFVEKKGTALHHIAFVVDDIERELSRLKKDGYELIDEKPRIGALGHKIAFLHPRSADGILIELQQR